ncbi:DUF4422 domain-containing protein [Bifidobacterium sp. ESL0728]|uniref:DUF4422 domain-containing protein n=1 Tax=Bifidobacterium sp. ESL0728 TaxID=2983220 RepID=UPI0023F77E54|nr:DUF4422 domain-containing protein [Bifidobacterium sp. ESL0728]WEV59325.1 DUF4422 domain-containing protein [Bifidobacterium sp. ESL0728]
MSKNICIAVAAHKPYRMPSDDIYLPMHVGASLHPEVDLGAQFVADNTGDNISDFNASYSEVTALYWLWKNCDADYKGLVHYRRHFATVNTVKRLFAKDRFDRIAKREDVEAALNKKTKDGSAIEIVLPKKRNYYIESVYSHYAHTFHAEQFDETRKILMEKQPEYVPAFDEVMAGKSAHIFNMFIMSRHRFDEYCAWLFPILDELTKRIDPNQYDAFNARYPGRVSERLLDVWLKTHSYVYTELPTVSPEPVNWPKKGSAFLQAKFFGKSYSKSF